MEQTDVILGRGSGRKGLLLISILLLVVLLGTLSLFVQRSNSRQGTLDVRGGEDLGEGVRGLFAPGDLTIQAPEEGGHYTLTFDAKGEPSGPAARVTIQRFEVAEGEEEEFLSILENGFLEGISMSTHYQRTVDGVTFDEVPTAFTSDQLKGLYAIFSDGELQVDEDGTRRYTKSVQIPGAHIEDVYEVAEKSFTMTNLFYPEFKESEWPIVDILVAEETRGSVTVSSADWQEYDLSLGELLGGEEIVLRYLNEEVVFERNELGEVTGVAQDKNLAVRAIRLLRASVSS